MTESSYKYEDAKRNQNPKGKSQSGETKNHERKYKKDLKEMSYHLAVHIVTFIDSLPKDMSCGVIGKQLLRSATSIGANISEARASNTRKDFINFMTYSLKSANESIFWLKLLQDSKKVVRLNLESLAQETDEIARILGASIITLRRDQQKT